MLGYLFWTISDNWEWADGYGPKFGLVAVDRANNLARIPRPSYHLFSKVKFCVCVCFVSVAVSFPHCCVDFADNLARILNFRWQ